MKFYISFSNKDAKMNMCFLQITDKNFVSEITFEVKPTLRRKSIGPFAEFSYKIAIFKRLEKYLK